MLLHSGTMANDRFRGFQLWYEISCAGSAPQELSDLEQELLIKLYDAFHYTLIPAALCSYYRSSASSHRRRKVTGHLHAARPDDEGNYRLTVKLRVNRHISRRLDATELFRLLEECVIQPVSVDYEEWCCSQAEHFACCTDGRAIEKGIEKYDDLESDQEPAPLGAIAA